MVRYGYEIYLEQYTSRAIRSPERITNIFQPSNLELITIERSNKILNPFIRNFQPLGDAST